jgi:hypothetical protein
MLEDVYVARKRNRYREPYGFVKFSNVRDVSTMTKALNAVWFGHFRVRASVAKFDRNASGPERSTEEVQTSLAKGVVTRKVDYQSPARQVNSGGEPRTKGRDGVGALDPAKEGLEVQVGDVVLKLRNQQKRAALNIGQQHEEEQAPKGPDAPVASVQEKECSIFLRSYRSKSDDVQWAHRGLVATVINGEAIPVVHNMIVDARFADVVITPIGADKVFIRRTEGGGVMSVLLLLALRIFSNTSSRTG